MATTRQIVGANGQILSIVVIPNAAGTAGDAQVVGLVDVNGTPLTPAQDSTLTGGTVRVITRNLAAITDVVTFVAQNGALTNTLSTPFAAATLDTPTFGVGNNNKRLFYIVVAVAITWVTSGQATVQPYVATSTQTGVGTLAPLIDTAQSLGASGVTLAAGTYVFDSTKFPSFTQPHLFMGLRFVFPSTPTNAAGASLITVLSGTNT